MFNQDELIKRMNKHNDNLSKYACRDFDAIRLKKELEDFRNPFFRDIDRIIYSLSYIRYIDKTQVFTNNENDMISKRITHVQMVSKIARTIGRALSLNEDLIEAAGLGHDLGHVPFGHLGEKILNKISLKYNEGYFNHNVQSVRILMQIENYGMGSNLTLQVLDAILSHNGEILENKYCPVSKDKTQFLDEYNLSYTDNTILKKIKPMTLEGCVVRISDIIAYIGKDLEDAIRLGKITNDDIPDNIKQILGTTNSEIVDTIVTDIINNSFNKNFIMMSKQVFGTLNELIAFNYKEIYANANTHDQISKIEIMFNDLFDLYYEQIINKEIESDIYKTFINDMNDEYKKNNTPARIVIDYIAGMTDDFFTNQYEKNFG